MLPGNRLAPLRHKVLKDLPKQNKWDNRKEKALRILERLPGYYRLHSFILKIIFKCKTYTAITVWVAMLSFLTIYTFMNPTPPLTTSQSEAIYEQVILMTVLLMGVVMLKGLLYKYRYPMFRGKWGM